jgi:hypothetical protein
VVLRVGFLEVEKVESQVVGSQVVPLVGFSEVEKVGSWVVPLVGFSEVEKVGSWVVLRVGS